VVFSFPVANEAFNHQRNSGVKAAVKLSKPTKLLLLSGLGCSLQLLVNLT
jgi:hypothetical protein